MSRESRKLLGPICDTHIHVFGDRDKYPMVAELRSQPPDAPLSRLLKEAEIEGVQRIVFDQPSHYGNDNSCSLDNIGSLGLQRGRAIVDVDENTVTAAELKALHARGARGIRVNYGYRETNPDIADKTVAHANKLAKMAADLGWHLEFLIPNWALRQVMPFFHTLPCDFSVGHMGVFPAAAGPSQEGFADFLKLHAKGRCWVKFTGVYRLSKLPGFTDIAPLARAFVANNPDRIIWGSDWPFLSHLDVITYQKCIELFEDWVPDPAMQKKILVDNPAKLFGF